MIQALGDRVIIKVIQKPKKPGLIIPLENDELIGEVISVGCKIDDDLFPGQFVYLMPLATGVGINHKGVDYLSVHSSHIVGFADTLEIYVQR